MAPTTGDVLPFWGCGLLGDLQGIGIDGTVTAPMQEMISALKLTNLYENQGKVSYWNWDYAPMTADGVKQTLTKDFLFMPENWGVTAADPRYVRTAHVANFLDSDGAVSPALMADIFLGANEPDITGSCMGDMMGTCTSPCTHPGCPVAHIHGKTPQPPPPHGQCDCWSDSHSTGSGFWPVAGCSGAQPLPQLFSGKDFGCVDSIMSDWQKTGKAVSDAGYKFLAAPLMAANMTWQKLFVREACRTCSDISCGCPTHVGWHFYANDCEPDNGGYAQFQTKLDATRELMEEFPHLQGAIVNEVGMLNCQMASASDGCIPNGPTQKYPALNQTNHTCPPTKAMPKGLGTFVEKLLDMVGQAKTTDGRRVVVSFSWFNLDMDGGTYNLRLFDDDGSLNVLGHSYMESCKKWAAL